MAANIFRVTSEDFNGDIDNYDEILKKMTQYFLEKNINIRDGDVIKVTDMPGYGYRNNGKFIWFNNEVRELYYRLDDYGSVPPYIEIDDTNHLHPYYWTTDNAIDHNSYIWFSKDIRARLEFSKTDDKDGITYSAKTIIKDVEYTFEFYQIKNDNKKNILTIDNVKWMLCENKCAFYTLDTNNIIGIHVR